MCSEVRARVLMRILSIRGGASRFCFQIRTESPCPFLAPFLPLPRPRFFCGHMGCWGRRLTLPMKAPHAPTKRASATKRTRGPGSKTRKRKTTKRKAHDANASEAKANPKRGKKEEYSAWIPRARQVFAMFLQNQNHPNSAKKFPTNAEIGKALQPDEPLGTAAVRSFST